MKIDHRFEIHGIHGKYSDNICTEASYQRNGVSGAGFTVIKFTHVPMPDYGDILDLIGIVFEAPKHVAVIDPTDLESHWRGDSFEDGLRVAAQVCHARWAEELNKR